MSKALRVICVEDSEEDSLLLLRELRNGGYYPVWKRIETADAMSVALEEGSWDLVLADFALPGFNALVALELVRQARLDLPFIVVSGVIGEEQAVAMMKAGAHDYVFKDNLRRLLPAIERELHETAVRRQRRRAEEALQKSEKKYKDLFDQSNDGILLHDEQGAILDANNKILEQLGYSRSEILNLRCPQLLSPGEVERTAKELQKAVILGSFTFETLFRRKNGAEFPVEISACRFDQEDHAFAQCIVRDITERKRAEEALRESEGRFRELCNSLPQLVWTCQPDGPCNFLSKQWIDYTGVPAEEQLGYGWLEQLHPDDRKPTMAAWQAAVDSGSDFFVEFRIRRHDGEYRSFDTRALRLRDAQGRTVRWVGSNTDITERKQAEERQRNFEAKLQQAQKLESLGVLAGGIAPRFQ